MKSAMAAENGKMHSFLGNIFWEYHHQLSTVQLFEAIWQAWAFSPTPRIFADLNEKERVKKEERKNEKPENW